MHLSLNQDVMTAGQHDGYMIFNTHFNISISESSCSKKRSHMGIKMSGFKSHHARKVQLGAYLFFHFIGSGMQDDCFNAWPQCPFLVHESGHIILSAYRPPAVVLPLTGQRK